MTSGDDQAPTPAASASIPDTIAGSQVDAFEERAWVAASGLPCCFGNCVLLEKIGEGGMGVVEPRTLEGKAGRIPSTSKVCLEVEVER
jgi:hypothetical protein